MIIQSIKLENFRNYNELDICFSDGTNIIYGDNAQGKTNILEAVYLCGTTKSHKGSKDREIIKFHNDESHIRTIISKNSIEYKIDMHLRKNKTKGIAINGIPIKKASDLFGIVNFVFFSPEDLNIIKNGPSERRRFIDLELCQLDKVYLYNLTNYNKIINQRNKLLRDLPYQSELKDTLSVWNLQLVNYGVKIIERRRLFIEQINQIIFKIHSNLTGGSEELFIKYEQNVSAEFFLNKLEQNISKDIKLKTTTVGPHRDDLNFLVKDIDIRKYGSQGQQRTAALSLKLSEIELVKNLIDDKPILLLDDVLSELDSNRQNYLLNSIYDIQTLITCTGLEEFINNRFSIDKIYKVNDGTVIIEN
ncbi:DNA replication and repair protein RecF [Lachnotalea glycerini]|uniref:DNA replication and repair protein RecF n=1 Tax=Lachnotalea glycerini TaxID=1763509 RepID=A0A255I6W8_9FIRM|nr:DNA replication/repair protein RecF [Lachnotalea glycerini]PXV85343.1 DNA replication and repair protein RecF [Lachnotalea glycerini]RDY30229.1 DNA replication/repair protein RecF [Lachnotalea glycerini]